jgi:hypothetical protein
MRFHFEDRGELRAIWTIANIDNACIFAGTANDPRGRGRQFLQMDTGGFVGAMLRPHYREYTQLDQIGFAAHGVQDARIFFFIETMVGDDLGRDFGHATGFSETAVCAPDKINGRWHRYQRPLRLSLEILATRAILSSV